MARLRYSPAAQPAGFRPIQLSRQEISRMQEESNRIVDNMERNRRAEIEQRRDNLQSMKENAAYTERANQRNFDIQQQNLQAQLIQSQLDAKNQQTQAALNIQATEQVFGGLATFSKSAAEISRKIEADKLVKDTNAKYIASSLGLDSQDSIDYRNAELLLKQKGEQWELNQSIQEAQGADPNAVAKARMSNPAVTHLSNKTSATYLLSNQFPLYLDSVLNDSETKFEYNGRQVTPSEARQDPGLLQIFGQVAKVQFLKQKGLWGIEDKMLMDGLQAADLYINQLSRKASADQTANIYAMRSEQAFGIALNDPSRFPENATTVFRQWASDPTLGFKGALDNYGKLALAKNEDGFLLPLESIGSADLKGTGKTFAEEFPVRWEAIKKARVDAEIEATQRDLAIEELGYRKDVERIQAGLTADSSQANADAAVEFFRKTYGQVPPEILKFQASYTTEAVAKAASAKKLLAIPAGFVTLEAVEAAESIDVETGRELRRRFQEQEARYNAGIYKETNESFKTIANGLTSYGTNKPNTPASVFLQTMMKAEYRNRVDKVVAGGMSFNEAATVIGQQLAQEVKAGASNPKSPWYRKTDTPGGDPTFPNLNNGRLSRAENARRRYDGLKWTIKTNGLEKVIDTKGSILTAEESQEVVKNYGKPGFTIPQNVLAVAGMSNGLDPMVIINRQLVAQGIKPLAPPPSMSSTEQLVSPAFRKLLYKSPSLNRSSRALGTANVFNAAIVPNNLGPVIQQASQAAGVNPTYIAALAEIESRFNVGSVSYNGSSFGVMQINKAAHPAFFAQQNWKDPQANVNYGAKYYSGLLKKYGDPVAAAMAYNAGPGNYDAYLQGKLPDGPTKTEMLNHGKKFAKVMYKYGGGSQALSHSSLMRTGSPVAMQFAPVKPLQSYRQQVSSVSFDSGQPGIDVFFEDKQFPAVLPGRVKDIGFQGGKGTGYGNYLVVESTDPETGEKVDVLYGHLAARPNLTVGQMIRTGQVIGKQGGTGRVVSADGTIASIDFLRAAPSGSQDMTPYRNYDALRRRIASQLRNL